MKNLSDLLGMVFGDQFRYKSHGLLVISKLLGASGALYFSFRAAVHLIWELPSSVWEQMERWARKVRLSPILAASVG